MPFRKDLNFGSDSINITPKPKTFSRNRDDLRKTLLTMAEDILLESESLGTFPVNENDDIPKGSGDGEPLEEEQIHLCWVSAIYRVQVQTGSNVCTSVVIDSGASATVCSLEFVKFLPPQVWKDRNSSEKKFRF